MLDSFLTVGQQVVYLFVIVLVGYVLGRVKLVNDTVSLGMSDLMLFVINPAVTIVSFQRPREAEGFLYLVSSLGVTGTREEITTDLASIVKVVRENTDVPCAIGFGISTPEQAAKMAGLSDGVIVGSAIIKLLEKHGENAPKHIGAYIKSMKDAMR